MTHKADCPFCEIVENDPHGQILETIDTFDLTNSICDVMIFEPLNPCVKGHLMFVPYLHIDNIGDQEDHNGAITAATFAAVNDYLKRHPQDCNIITNNGKGADQSIFHLHVHLIPRTEGDNVQLPWTYQKG